MDLNPKLECLCLPFLVLFQYARYEIPVFDQFGRFQKKDVTFQGLAQNTCTNRVTYNSLADLETVINMGMKEGLTSTLERLDDLLLTLNHLDLKTNKIIFWWRQSSCSV